METAGTTGLGSSFGLGFRGTIPKLVSFAKKMISQNIFNLQKFRDSNLFANEVIY